MRADPPQRTHAARHDAGHATHEAARGLAARQPDGLSPGPHAGPTPTERPLHDRRQAGAILGTQWIAPTNPRRPCPYRNRAARSHRASGGSVSRRASPSALLQEPILPLEKISAIRRCRRDHDILATLDCGLAEPRSGRRPAPRHDDHAYAGHSERSHAPIASHRRRSGTDGLVRRGVTGSRAAGREDNRIMAAAATKTP